MHFSNAENIREDIRDIDRKIACLESCFTVVSQPQLVDSVNLQLSALRLRRRALFEQLKASWEHTCLSEK